MLIVLQCLYTFSPPTINKQYVQYCFGMIAFKSEAANYIMTCEKY